MHTLRFAPNDPYKITLETVEQFKDSFHSQAFDMAEKHLKDISDRYRHSQEESSGQPKSDFFYDVDEVNNIIAFTGDRGSGKTTAMLSFVSCLREDQRQIGCKIGKERIYYHVLPVVDPSKLGGDESLLGVIVARIYERVTKIIEGQRNDGNLSSDQIREAVRKCEKAYLAIRNRYSGTKALVKEAPKTELEQLSNLANTSTLRKCLQDLITEYLKLDINANGLRRNVNNTMLVIPVDDLDMSVRNGYELAEEIRNFFLLPQIVITMAVKIEQLSDLVEQKFLNDFEKMINQKNVLDTQPAEMAVKYIEKLIPHQRRIYMTSFTPQSMADLRVEYGATNLNVHENEKSQRMIDFFIGLVYTRTGILLYPNQFGSHALIPHNLRALHQTVKFFDGLQPAFDLKGNLANTDVISGNLQSVKSWLLDSACANAIPRDLAMVIRRASEHANDGLNAFVARELEQCSVRSERQNIGREGKPVFIGLFGTERHIQNLFGEGTYPENISLGDVLYLLHRMEQMDLSNGMMHFSAALKLLYSLRLTEALLVNTSCGDDESRYREACKIVGGTFCPMQIELLERGKEWMVNIPTTTMVVKTDNGYRYLNNDEYKATNNPKPYTGHRLAWLSYFSVSFGGRLRYKSLHTYTGRYPNSRYTPRLTEENDDFMSAHWMQFLRSMLTPTDTQRRILWIAEEMRASDVISQASEFAKAMLEWRNKYIRMLNINSIDLVAALFVELSQTARQRTDNIGLIQGYFDIRRALVGAPETPDYQSCNEQQSIFIQLRERLSNENTLARQLLTMMQFTLSECPLFKDDRLEDWSAGDSAMPSMPEWVEQTKLLNALIT